MKANDFDNLDVKSQAIATSVATIVKVGITFIHTFDGRAFWIFDFSNSNSEQLWLVHNLLRLVFFLSFQENYDAIKIDWFYLCVKILTLLHKLSVCCFWFIIWHLDFYQLIVNIQIMLPKISVSNDKFLDKIPQFLAKEKPGKSARKPPSNIKSKTQVWVEKFSVS